MRRNFIFFSIVILIAILTVIYRFYQPMTAGALTQFDVFDWAGRSKEWLLFGHMLIPTSLWVFPAWNAIVAKLTGINLFYIYLYSGAILTTLNLFILYGISSLLWRQRILRLVPLIFYALNTQLLARSMNYLPETMSFTFGLTLVYFYLRLIYSRRPWWLIPIGILNYLYYHLHQSGMNFLFFTAVVVIIYMFFIIHQTWKGKLIWLTGIIVTGFGIFFSNAGIRQQINFFLNGNQNSSTDFHGTAIPFSQLFTDYRVVFLTMLILGALSIMCLLFQHRQTKEKVTWFIILMIVSFYFSFLYVLPNLKLYSLTPWRFYTWFSLYAVLIASQGVAVLLKIIGRKSSMLILLFFCFLVVNLVHDNLISDNMYTANMATLKSMEQLNLPENSLVITTNANYLQTRYALLGRSLTFYQAAQDFFKASDTKTAYAYLTDKYNMDSTYILISLYQLRQRPSSIDYWRNSSIYDMNLDLFADNRYFTEIYSDEQIVVFRGLSNSIHD